jgi:hypothetical protein
MRPNLLIPPLCGLVVLTSAGCPDTDGDDSGTPGSKTLAGTWNLEENAGYTYPYSYTEDGCVATYTSELSISASLSGSWLDHTDFGAGCNATEHVDHTDVWAEVEAEEIGDGLYELSLYLPPPANSHLTYICTVSGSVLSCEDDEDGSIARFERA